MSILETLEDYSWTLLEKVGLDEFFDERNLSPLLFPATILIVLAILIFLLLPQASISEVSGVCGNGLCEPELDEDFLSCPGDCALVSENLKTVIVEVISSRKAELIVKLEDSERKLIRTVSGFDNFFTFSDIDTSKVFAIVTNPQNSQTITSELTELDDETTITILPSLGFFEEIPDPVQKAGLKVTLIDSETGELVTGKVSIVIPNGPSQVLETVKTIRGVDVFTLDSNQWYALIVSADGYELYENRGNPIMLEGGAERELLVELHTLPNEPQLSTLTVCTSSDIPLSGTLEMSSLLGDSLAIQNIIDGCTVFETEANTVTVSTGGLPDKCVGTSAEITLQKGDNFLDIPVFCNSATTFKVKVLSEDGTTLTQGAVITAWYSDNKQIYASGPGGSLYVPGLYSESVAADSMKQIYFIITGLEDYETFKSSQYSLNSSKETIITLTMKTAPEAAEEFIFSGVSYPNPISIGEEFKLSVSRIIYGQTDVTDFVNVDVQFKGVAMELGGEPCVVELGAIWSATCIAPTIPGTYDIAISADYNGHDAVEVRQIDVLEFGPSHYFEITPHAQLDKVPAFDLKFDITFNDTPVLSLAEGYSEIYYVLGEIIIDEKVDLTDDNGTYILSVNSPYPGDHKATIYLKKIINNLIYEETFVYYFESEPTSKRLTTEQILNPRILKPLEKFVTYLKITYLGEEVADLQNVYANADGQRQNLIWNDELHVYERTFTASGDEGIYHLIINLENQELADGKYYVVNTEKDKSQDCPIDECSNRPEVRKCVDKHNKDDMYSETDLVTCIERGLMVRGDRDITFCTSNSNRGDWDDNCALDANDVYIMEDFFTKIPSPGERNEYYGCGDLDRDGDVDNNDQICLTNIISTKWFGDVGDETCEDSMSGGFCFDIDTTLAGDFDASGAFDTQDLSKMWLIVNSVSSGVKASSELLNASDFNMDGSINSADYACLEEIAGTGAITPECLAVYGFGCVDIPGDLTQDEALDGLDVMLENWVVDGRVDSEPIFTCVDTNLDWMVTDDDVSCLEAMIDNDAYGIETFCNPCFLEMQRYGRYGEEVCHDGLDNNCNNQVDEDCECSASQSCSRLYDVDGDPSTNDFEICMAFGDRGFTSPGVSSTTTTTTTSSSSSDDGDYSWHTLGEWNEACNEAEDWGNIVYCGGGEATCVFAFGIGFSMSATATENLLLSQQLGEGQTLTTLTPEQREEMTSTGEYEESLFWASYQSFAWDFVEGVIGPVGVVEHCDDCGPCPEGWGRVGGCGSGGSCSCNFFGSCDDHKCAFCRYQYDNCQGQSCAPSGSGIPNFASCNDDWDTMYTEACPAEGCFGATLGTEKGLGHHDNRYGRYVIWKSISESDGNLVVFLEDAVGKNIAAVYVAKDPNLRFGILDEGYDAGDYSGWPHYRFHQPGIEYGPCYLVVVYDEEGIESNPVHVPYGGKYEDEYRLVYHILTGASRYSDH